MKKHILSLISLVIILLTGCSNGNKETWITGEIVNPGDSMLQIGDSILPVTREGKITFRINLKSPVFYDVSYRKITWGLYAEPGKKIGFILRSDNLSDLVFYGDLVNENNILKESIRIFEVTNSILNQEWINIHKKNEQDFLSVIDSLQALFLNQILSSQNKDNISGEFCQLYSTDVKYGFGPMIFHYPDLHLAYSGEKISLSRSILDYLNTIPTDNREYFHLSNYKSFCKSRIDFQANQIAIQNQDNVYFNAKKMQAVFQVVPEMFKDLYIRDYWKSEYLAEFIDLNGITNSASFISGFKADAVEKEFIQKIDDQINTELANREDHLVRIFKEVNGFVLEAHIFYPKKNMKKEKRAAMVIFHGGGFVLGNPSWAFGKARHYSELGMIAVAAQYRLSNYNDITPLDAIQDAKDLMLWLRENADSLGIMVNKIAASGWSVGAQLCATLAVFPDILPDSEINSSPDAILLTSPGTDTKGWFTELLNGNIVNPQDYSPVDHIRTGLPPCIILQGRDDTVTPLDGVQVFYDKLIAKNNYCEIWIYDNVGHLFTPTSLGDNGWPHPDKNIQEQADEKADDFLRKFDFIEK
jgi:acetyl esterase/lipase